MSDTPRMSDEQVHDWCRWADGVWTSQTPTACEARDELLRARAAEDDLRRELATETETRLGACEAIDTCHQECADLQECCDDWAERCAKLEAELAEANVKLQASRADRLALAAKKRAAVRLTSDWQARCEQAEARVALREGALRECQALAMSGDCAECGEIFLIVENLLGEEMPHA